MSIENFRRDTSRPLQADVCIVGGGAAGITLALELARAKVDVLLLEAGGLNRSGDSQSLYAGEVSDTRRHLALDQARYRQLGGTTALWGGRCLPYDAIDFERREWVQHSGWPIEYSQLDSSYRRAHEYCQCGPYDYAAATALPGGTDELIDGFRDPDVLADSIERWSPPTHFGRYYRRELSREPHIRVLLHAVATRVALSTDGSQATGVEVAGPGGGRQAVHAKHYVLAGGGLETTRLLMSSEEDHAGALGGSSGWLGAGYMCHIHGSIARLRLVPGAHAIFGYEKDTQGIFCRRRLRVSAEAQRRHQLLNSFILLDRPLLADPEHGSALFSAAFLAKRLLRSRSSETLGKGKYALYWAHLRNVLSGSPQAMSVLPRMLRQRMLHGRRIPSLLQSPRSNDFHLYFQLEQIPSRLNRVSLGENRDELGMRRLRLQFAIQPEEIDSALRIHQLVADAIARSGRGELQYLDGAAPQDLVAASSAVLGHHIGTTRMARSARDGVVDEYCRVHGVRNLHIASSSTFPTSSHANPTLTIVAMAVRLAARLGILLREQIPELRDRQVAG